MTSLGRERTALGGSSAARTHCERFAFGGVAFELLCAAGPSAGALTPEERRFCVSRQSSKAIADVFCAVHDDPAFTAGQRSHDGVRFRDTDADSDSALSVHAPGFVAELAQLGAQRYAAAARLGPGPDGYAGLLRGISAAVLQRLGGLVVHAAAVELDGRAVLFVGPSGAGKSTAVRLTEAGRCFAYDHVALVPSEGGWLAWGLPGGKAADAPLAPEVVYPLAAVLRVHHAATGEPRVTRLASTQALFALRESVESTEETFASEARSLRAMTRLSSTVAVGTIATVLNRSTSSVLRAWLAVVTSRERGS